MTEIKQALTYRRTSGAMWRDTGRHVLVLPAGSTTDVKVLGGGGATLWRLLDEPRTAAQLHAELTAAVATPPPFDELEACLAELVGEGMLGTEATS